MNFKEFCVEYNFNDILDLWDYVLNGDVNPEDVTYRSNKKRYFKCPRGLHESREIGINPLTSALEKKGTYMMCQKCASIGQYIVDNYGEETLNWIWSDKNEIGPFDKPKEKQRIWIRCINKNDNHPDHDATINNMRKTIGCPYCNGNKVAEDNSFGHHYPHMIARWSTKNMKSPYEYTKKSNEKVWFTCPIGKHADYEQSIDHAFTSNFQCNQCYRDTHPLLEDLTGKKFGRLTVVEYDEEGSKTENGTRWFCDCECGETRKSILASHLKSGKITSCGCFFKESISGENNWNWKGGLSDENKKIRTSQEMKEFQKAVYKRDHYTCQCCGSKKNIHAHHIENFADCIEKRFDVNNGITLCFDCHLKAGTSFHAIYSNRNNTREQLDEFIRNYKLANNINI